MRDICMELLLSNINTNPTYIDPRQSQPLYYYHRIYNITNVAPFRMLLYDVQSNSVKKV